MGETCLKLDKKGGGKMRKEEREKRERKKEEKKKEKGREKHVRTYENKKKTGKNSQSPFTTSAIISSSKTTFSKNEIFVFFDENIAKNFDANISKSRRFLSLFFSLFSLSFSLFVPSFFQRENEVYEK